MTNSNLMKNSNLIKNVDEYTYSVWIGVTLTATVVHLDTAVPTTDPAHDVESNATRYQKDPSPLPGRKDPVSLLEAAAALITADCLRLVMPATAVLGIATRHQRNPSPLPVSENPAELPGTDVAPATDAHKRRRYFLEFPRGGLPTFLPGQLHHSSFENWR